MCVGDLATLAAAFCYSMATVRIPLYAKKVEPLKLALGKSLVLTTISVIGVATQMFGVPWSDIIPLHISQGHTVQVLSLIAWSAVGPGAVSAYLHVKGQSMVSPTDAQIIFTSVPLWSAIIASIFLPDERIGTLTWIGGAGLVIAGLIATFSADKK
jgi:drug/metabolite transporter (DMT)-like permease